MNLYLLLPEIAVMVLAGVVFLLDLVVRRKQILVTISLLGLIVAAILTLLLVNAQGTGFSGTLVVDSYSLFFKLIFLAVAALVIMASGEYVNRMPRLHGEYYGLILLSTVGMMLLASTLELISIYIALELTTIPLFILAGMLRDQKSTEASLKYLLLGAISSAILLYGLALIFGLTGTTYLPDIATQLKAQLGAGGTTTALMLAIAFVVAGLGFKIAAVPFQMWAPDVYEGAPTPVTAFLSVGSKAAGFALAVRLFLTAFGGLPVDWALLFAVLSALSMTVGNLVAIVQNNIKRLMAYSSIAQAGYVLVGVATGTLLGTSGVLFFLLSYAFTNLGAFIAIIAISDRVGSDRIDDYAGMFRRSPWLAFALTFCMLSLIGIPPTAGFVAKFYLFSAAVENNLAWLVAIGVVNSVVSAYYYLRVVKVMYLASPPTEEQVRSVPLLNTALSAAVVGVFVVFIISSPLLRLAETAALGFFK